ncbi:sugar transferase [Rhizobium cremeum]|uniref:sugar transferase n=1 Tax=Rhizobium cremeum TaxID=2813827 RepID=UPI000DD614EE|nr:sugar transferase [Rhizobium cremeum]MCJ7993711.1 sugar transferase [Rhizobium cremeum]MCJ7998768.1 sugar transferase [Rhizobium cremeum]
MMKRLFDFSAALVGLILTSPVMAVIAIVVRATSPGPALFIQTRVGRNEVPFRCYKFRTMATGTPDVASHHASTAWITPVGGWLRAYKLDELPQLLNVVLGEMSLVGPRPCLPSQAEMISERRKQGVFSARPGITGSAQLAGIDMSEPARLAEADRQYIERQSFTGDLAILIATALGRGAGDAARK